MIEISHEVSYYNRKILDFESNFLKIN